MDGMGLGVIPQRLPRHTPWWWRTGGCALRDLSAYCLASIQCHSTSACRATTVDGFIRLGRSNTGVILQWLTFLVGAVDFLFGYSLTK